MARTSYQARTVSSVGCARLPMATHCQRSQVGKFSGYRFGLKDGHYGDMSGKHRQTYTFMLFRSSRHAARAGVCDVWHAASWTAQRHFWCLALDPLCAFVWCDEDEYVLVMCQRLPKYCSCTYVVSGPSSVMSYPDSRRGHRVCAIVKIHIVSYLLRQDVGTLGYKPFYVTMQWGMPSIVQSPITT